MTELNNGIQNGAQEVSKLMLKAVFWDMNEHADRFRTVLA